MTLKSVQAADALALDRAISSGNSEGSLLAKTAAHVTGAFQRLKQERMIKATIRQLEDLDDATLRDIGVNRSEIESAVRSRFKAR